MSSQEKNLRNKIGEKAVDVRNEAIQQGATFYLLARRVLLAGLGAMALSAEEAQAFLDRLVERGEIAEAEAQQLLEDFRQRAREREERVRQAAVEQSDVVGQRARRGLDQAEGQVEERIGAILKSMNVPTKREIDELSAKISELSAKIDQIKQG